MFFRIKDLEPPLSLWHSDKNNHIFDCSCTWLMWGWACRSWVFCTGTLRCERSWSDWLATQRTSSNWKMKFGGQRRNSLTHTWSLNLCARPNHIFLNTCKNNYLFFRLFFEAKCDCLSGVPMLLFGHSHQTLYPVSWINHSQLQVTEPKWWPSCSAGIDLKLKWVAEVIVFN